MHAHNNKVEHVQKTNKLFCSLKNVRLATMNPAIKGAAYGLIEDATIVINNKEIRWCGPTADLPNTFHSQQTCDFAGRLVTPALIDCHSHLIFGGNRAREFELRLKGLSYEDIARQGGGIKETVRMTRDASDQDLLTQALTRVDSLINEGVADIEIKSGYGLNIDDELRMLRVARHIETKRQVDIHTSFLGAHALPPEYNKRPEAYLVEVCLPALEAAHNQGLVDAVDGFCENIAFSTEQISRVFDCAKRLGLPVKLHAEQLSLSGAAALAASYQALSADHLEYIDEKKHKSHRFICCGSTVLPWLLPPTATPAALPCIQFYWRPIWLAPCSASPQKKPWRALRVKQPRLWA